MSSTAFTGLAVLENPRVIPKTKTVVFDLQACLPSSEPALIGSVRYFNRDNLDFPEVGCYAAWISVRSFLLIFFFLYSNSIQVARTLPTVEVYSQDLGPMDYHVIGDALWVRGMPYYTSCPDNSPKLIPLGSPEDFCLSQPAFVQVCGLAANPNKDDATFEVVAEQYVTATRSAECFPIRCLIPEDTEKEKKNLPDSLRDNSAASRPSQINNIPSACRRI